MVDDFQERWVYYAVLRSLAKEDLTRLDEMAGLPLFTVFNDLAFQHDQRIAENYINKRNQNKNG